MSPHLDPAPLLTEACHDVEVEVVEAVVETCYDENVCVANDISVIVS